MLSSTIKTLMGGTVTSRKAIAAGLRGGDGSPPMVSAAGFLLRFIFRAVCAKCGEPIRFGGVTEVLWSGICAGGVGRGGAGGATPLTCDLESEREVSVVLSSNVFHRTYHGYTRLMRVYGRTACVLSAISWSFVSSPQTLCSRRRKRR